MMGGRIKVPMLPIICTHFRVFSTAGFAISARAFGVNILMPQMRLAMKAPITKEKK